MAAVGLIPTGQCSVQLPCEWQTVQPPPGRHLVEHFAGADVAFVVDQGPGPVERGRSEIIRTPPHDVAGAVADGAG